MKNSTGIAGNIFSALAKAKINVKMIDQGSSELNIIKQDLVEVLKELDQDLVKGAVAGEKFEELFFANCKNEKIAEYVKTLR